MTVLELLARQAAEHRELSRDLGVDYTNARPAVEAAEAELAAARARRESLLRQLDELEREAAEARVEQERAEVAHRDALAVLSRHEAQAQQAADIAESLDRIAGRVRGQQPAPPHEQHDATGLMREPAKVISATLYQDNGLPMVWSTHDAPGGYVCAMPPADAGGIDMPDGTRVCGMPVESVPCSEHGQPDADPFNLTQAAPETVAAITGGHPIIAPRGPGDAATLHAIDRGDPLRTLGDRPPHPPGHHAAPRASRVTGALRKVGLVAGPDDQPATGDEQDGEGQ